MFNLFRSRDKAVRITLTVLLGLVGLSMVTYLIPTSGQDPVYTDTTVVASVGKEDLTAQQVSRAVQNMTRQRQLPADLLSIYVPQMVQEMISERALAYEAERLGVKVSADETDNAIVDSMPADIVKDGKVDTATLNAMMQQQGLSMAELRSETARQLMIARLRQTVAQGVFVSPREIETEYHRRNDKIKVDYALVAPARYQADAEPNDAELKAYYDAHKAGFKTQEKRSLGLIVLETAKIAAGLQPTDDDLRRDYTANMDKFRTPERVQARHLLVKSDATNDAAMKTKAEGLLKQIRGGGDFAKLATANSDDPGSKPQGGELGYIVRGQTVPEFEKAAFTLQPGQISELVKTTYGYHIIQVEKHEQPRLSPFEEVKIQIMNDYAQRVAAEQIQKLSDKALAELRKDPAHPEKAAAAVGTTVIRADNVVAGDPIPGVGVSKELSDAVAALHKGEVTSGPVVLAGTRMAVASVLEFEPSRAATMEEAKTDVRLGARDQKLQKILTQKVADLALRTQALNGDLQKAAKEMGIEVKTSNEVDRQGAIEGVGTATTIADAFTKPIGSVIGPLSVAGGRVFAKVLSRTEADLAGLGVDTVKLRDELKAQKARDRGMLFEDGLKKRLEAEGKLKIRQDAIARLVQSFSGKS